jgi:hypothetical protein
MEMDYAKQKVELSFHEKKVINMFLKKIKLIQYSLS